jgi:hypothetical protein
MSAIGFDTLKIARKLKEAGVPDKQAEAQAEVLGEAFLYNLDEIVTRDYLDSRLVPINARLDGIDARLDGIDARLDRMDARFDGIDARLDRMDGRFDGIDARLNQIDQHFIEIDGKFRLVYWMLGMIIVVNVIPILSRLLV